eukprot:gene10838-2914_t
MDDDKRSKSEDSSLTSDINDNQNELEQFRLQWQAELALQRHGQKQESSSTQPELQQPTELALQPIATSDTIEQKALDLHVKAMELEEEGYQTEAMLYYRRATKLVPDIEFRAHKLLNQQVEEQLKRTRAHHEDATLSVKLSAEPKSAEMHVSDLPSEVIHRIALHLLNPAYDPVPIFRLSWTCRYLFVVLYDNCFWKECAETLWQTPLTSFQPWTSWRQFAISKPRPLFHGIYVSKVTYLRRGEQALDDLYRPWHVVQYYRYIRLLPDHTAITATSCDSPSKVVQTLRQAVTKTHKELLYGTWSVDENILTVELQKETQQRISQQDHNQQRRRRGRNDTALMSCTVLHTQYHLRLCIRQRDNIPSNRLFTPHTSLAHDAVWESYDITQTFSDGTSTNTLLDLTEQYKPFRFYPADLFSVTITT